LRRRSTATILFLLNYITGSDPDKWLFLWENRSNRGYFLLLEPAFWGQNSIVRKVPCIFQETDFHFSHFRYVLHSLFFLIRFKILMIHDSAVLDCSLRITQPLMHQAFQVPLFLLFSGQWYGFNCRPSCFINCSAIFL